MALDPLSAVFELGKSAIERIWPDPNKRAEELRLLEELRQKGDLAELQARVGLLQGQLQINMQEAKHGSIFVAGWRPFVGWVCGFSLAYIGVLEPLLRFIAAMAGYTGEFPVLDTTVTLQVLLGMLGLAGMRMREKEKKVSREGLE